MGTGEIKAGKTTLFNAVGWCLYGTETQFLLGTKTEEKDEKPIPSESSYEGDKAVVEVEIDIKIPENDFIESLSIRRLATYTKGATYPSHTNFSVSAYHGGEKLRLSDDTKFLNSFLPKDLLQFYLFDGEYLTHTATNSNLKIRDGLRRLFNIEKIENVSSTIDELVQEWYRQSSKMPKQNIRITEIDNDIAVFLERKHTEEQKITEEEKNILELTDLRDTLQEELSKSQDLQVAIERFNMLETQEKEIEKQIKEGNIAYYTNVLTNAYLINGQSVMREVNKIVAKEPKIKDLPANQRQIFLNRLLDKGKCVCGTLIKKGSNEEKSVIAELKVAESEERLDFLVDLAYKISETLKSAEERQNDITSKASEIRKLEEKRKKARSDKDEIQKQLPEGKSDVTSYKSRLSKFTTISDDIRDADRNLADYKDNVQDLQKSIDELKQERGKILEKSGEASTLNTNIKTGEYLKRIFDRFNREILNNVATELETEINDLIAQNKKISELMVKITTENNNIDFKFAEKGSTKHYLTGGQNQLFGIIIMAAFVRIMDRRGRDKLPFVFMDNPFSSIDKASLEVASNNISELFKNAQIILFTTNDKFDKVLSGAEEHIFTAMTFTNDGSNVKFKVHGE